MRYPFEATGTSFGVFHVTVMGTGKPEGGQAPKIFHMGFVKVHPNTIVAGHLDLAHKASKFNPNPTPIEGSKTY